jgi:hypothetical protein
MINSVSFFQSQRGLSPALTLSWSAPTVGAASLYEVYVYEDALQDLGGSVGDTWLPSKFVAWFAIADTQLTIPSGVLSAGGNYQFWLRAFTAPGADLLSETCGIFLDQASAIAWSGLITIAGSVSSSQEVAAGTQSRTPIPPRVLREQDRARRQLREALQAIAAKEHNQR